MLIMYIHVSVQRRLIYLLKNDNNGNENILA